MNLLKERRIKAVVNYKIRLKLFWAGRNIIVYNLYCKKNTLKLYPLKQLTFSVSIYDYIDLYKVATHSGSSGNFQVIKNLRETQGSFDFF